MKNASLGFLFCILLFCFLLFFVEKPAPTPQIIFSHSEEILLYHPETDSVQKMPLEQYICYCLAGEMPASFHPEALKAQAVAIRSYVCRKIAGGTSHPKNADICTDYAHCAAFSGQFDSFPEATKEIYRTAVSETENEVLYYKEEPANTVFHAMSNGRTESAENVWGSAVPYLISVDSQLDTQLDNYETVAVFSAETLAEKMDVENASCKAPTYHEGGTVQEIQIGEKIFSGREVREKLGLRSASFSVTEKDSDIIFTVHGFGHGVGMSQEGANAYAKKGFSYTDILEKYYPNTTLCRLH